MVQVIEEWEADRAMKLVGRSANYMKSRKLRLYTQTTIIGCVLLCVSTRISDADYINGNQLLEKCTSSSFERKLFCLGYIEAISDAMQHQTINGFKGCVSTEIAAGQLQDVVVDFLRQHAADRHLAAESMVARAVSEAFPCGPLHSN